MSVRTRSSANDESTNVEGANAGSASTESANQVNVGTEAANSVEQDLMGSEADITSQTQIINLMNMMKAQQDLINKLLSSQGGNTPNSSPNPRARTLKAPPIPAYAGKKDEKTSVKVKGFIYNVRKVGKLSGMTDLELLDLAECHLQSHAATWMMKLEKDKKKPSTLNEMETMMLKEFVPSDERARARMKLMTFKQSKDMETHITRFQELVEVCSMGVTETYLFFFLSLKGKFKEECTKEFPTGEPDEMQVVYDFVRTVDRSLQWNPETESSTRGSNAGGQGSQGPWNSGGRGGKGGKGNKETGNPNNDKGNSKKKDDDLESWGPCQRKERSLYRKADRCFHCGFKGYSTKSCGCHKKPSGDSNNESAPKG